MTENNADREVCVWTYWVRADAEEEFRGLLDRHWPTLNRLGFVTDDPPMILRSSDDPPVYVEIATREAGAMEERPEQHNVPGMSFPFYRKA
jgi:hypothetical protein